MRPVIRTTCQVADRLDVATQFVRDDNARLAKPTNQALQKTLGRLCVTVLLNQYIKDTPIGVDGPPKPELLSIDRDDHFIEMPFVCCFRPIATNAIREMASKTVDPEPDGLARHNDTAFCKQIFDICRTQRKAVIYPDCVGHDLSGKAEAFQARHRSRCFHVDRLSPHMRLINLAMPPKRVPGQRSATHLQALLDDLRETRELGMTRADGIGTPEDHLAEAARRQ